MAANTTPIFIGTPNVGLVSITAATTASNGDGPMFSLITASANGTRVDAVRFRNSQITYVASTAMTHKIFYSPTNESGSATSWLIGEVQTATATRSNSALGATSIYTFDQPLIMASGSGLFVAQSAYTDARDRFDAMAFAGDY